MVLLAKITSPTEAKHLRPISMGSTAGKLVSRMLLNRTLPFVTARQHSQCAATGRQSADYLFSILRLMMLEREWHTGICFLKLDIAKAFDSVNRERLLLQLESRISQSLQLKPKHKPRKQHRKA